jgi:CRISPR-associated protein Cmr6
MRRNRQQGRENRSPQTDSSPEFQVPDDTRAVLQANINSCQNMGLILTRYTSKQAIQDEKGKGPWLRERAKKFQVDDQLIGAIYQRWQTTTANTEHFKTRSMGRLVVGLGGESVLETSLTLQFITGLPIIPGSALKGLCRQYALFTIAAQLGIKPLTASELRNRKDPTPLQNLDELMAAKDDVRKELLKKEGFQQLGVSLDALKHQDIEKDIDSFRAIFGSTDYGGVCIFYDAVVSALPQTGTLFEVDVMTPHFPDYYTSSGSKPPSDDQNPNPINFLTVATGTEFAFAVGVRRRDFDKSLAEKAVKWLKTALYEMGIGAKTAAGYGVFEKVK